MIYWKLLDFWKSYITPESDCRWMLALVIDRPKRHSREVLFGLPMVLIGLPSMNKVAERCYPFSLNSLTPLLLSLWSLDGQRYLVFLFVEESRSSSSSSSSSSSISMYVCMYIFIIIIAVRLVHILKPRLCIGYSFVLPLFQSVYDKSIASHVCTNREEANSTGLQQYTPHILDQSADYVE